MNDPFMILWVLVLICSLIIEASTLTLISVWFAAGAVVSILCTWLGLDFYVQLLACLITAGVLIIFVTPKLRKFILKSKKPTNADRIIGMEGIVTEDINEIQGMGQVKVAGATWSAKSADNSFIPTGSLVLVVKIEGVKAIVKIKEEVK